MRALSDTTPSQFVPSQFADADFAEAAADVAVADESVHPYRAWIWLGVFAAGAGFWFAVGLGIHALMQ